MLAEPRRRRVVAGARPPRSEPGSRCRRARRPARAPGGRAAPSRRAERARVADRGGRVAHDRRRHAARLERGDRLGRSSCAAAQARDQRVELGRVRDPPVAVREALVLDRARAARAPRRRRARTRRSARRARRARRSSAKIPNGARRGTTLPVRIAIPARSIVSHGSVATSEVSAPSSATSTCWPRPVRSRISSAASVPITAKSGPIRSPNGTAFRTGGSPSLPGRRHQAAQRLEDRVHALSGLAGAEAADRDVDDPRVDAGGVRVADPDPVGGAGAEVLDHDVGVPDEVGEDRARLRAASGSSVTLSLLRPRSSIETDMSVVVLAGEMQAGVGRRRARCCATGRRRPGSRP